MQVADPDGTPSRSRSSVRTKTCAVAWSAHVTRTEADRWAKQLDERLEVRVRRGHRDDFAFDAGVVVSNVHQVKGLEFDGVVLVEPATYPVRDRNLLHVAVTRAADQLWVVARGSRGLLAAP